MAKQERKQRRNDEAIAILGSNVRRYRELAGFTIMELAFKLGVDYSQISRIERGVVNTNISFIFDIANVLNIKPAQLLDK